MHSEQRGHFDAKGRSSSRLWKSLDSMEASVSQQAFGDAKAPGREDLVGVEQALDARHERRRRRALERHLDERPVRPAEERAGAIELARERGEGC